MTGSLILQALELIANGSSRAGRIAGSGILPDGRGHSIVPRGNPAVVYDIALQRTEELLNRRFAPNHSGNKQPP